MGNDNQKKTLYLIERPGNPPIQLSNIKYLIFSVGSIRGLALVAALDQLLLYCKLANIDLYKQVRGLAGSSVGSLVALAICINIKPVEMLDFFDADLFSNLANFHVQFLCKQRSVIDTTPFRNKISSTLRQKGFEENITFEELFAKTNKHLHIAAFNLKTKKGEMFGYKKTPKSRVLDAIMASCAMPRIFPPVIVDNSDGRGQCYIDGFIDNELPLREFDDIYSTLAFYLYDAYRKETIGNKLFRSLTAEEKNHVISIDVSKIGSVQFQLTPELMKWIEQQGKRAVSIYFNQ